MYYTLEIQKLLNRANVLDDNEKSKIKYYLEAINIADVNEDISFAYDLRSKLLDIEWSHPNRPNFLNTFSWMLNAFDSNPNMFDVVDLLWKYKWVISELNSNPDVSMEQIDKVLEDFKRRSEEAGFNFRAYYSKLLHEAVDQLDSAKAREYQDMLEKFDRDYISDCEACEIDSDVSVSLIEGNFDEALSKASPLLEEVLTCAKVPFVTKVNLAYYAFKQGNVELCKKFVQEIENELAEREEDSYLINNIGYFLAVVFRINEKEAWNYFQKFVYYTIDVDASTLFFFSIGLLEGLEVIDSKKVIMLSLPEELPYYKEDNEYLVNDIVLYYKQLAQDLADKFDSRNQNSNFSKQLPF